MASLESLLKHAYRLVDERDGGCCLHPGCGSSYNTYHHHIEFRSEAKDRIDCVENIVTSYYMPKAEQNELERLRLRRFRDQSLRERLMELEEKWRIWEECRIRA